MAYPNGTRFNDFVLVNEKRNGRVVPCIRRWVYPPGDPDGIYERFPLPEYRKFRDDPEELARFVVRLNNKLPEEQRTRRKLEIDHAYLTPALMAEYETYIRTVISSEREWNRIYNQTLRCFVYFYVQQAGIANPVDWHKNQTLWSYALTNSFPSELSRSRVKALRLFDEGEVPAASTVRHIVQNANRFVRWLHQQRPDYIPPLEFNPVPKAILKRLDASRELKGLVKTKWFIDDDAWKVIRKALDAHSTIRPYALLAYHFGLRRAEAMAVALTDVKKEYLSIERQLQGIPDGEPVFDVLKGRKTRKVPYWHCPPLDAYRIIKEEAQRPKVHPDTFSDLWVEFMGELGFEFSIHDLRRTWITKCFRVPGVLPTDIQLAAGHVNIETTMKYKLDDRQLNDELFVPDDDA